MQKSDRQYHSDKKRTPKDVVVDEQYQGPWLYLLEKYVGSLTGSLVLDVGCGKGGLVLGLSKLGASPVGVDPKNTLPVLSEGIKRSVGHKLPLVCGDGRELPFQSNSFDIVVSIAVLEHITRPRDFVKEMARVLKPGGTFLLFFGPNKWLHFTQSSSHRNIVFTYWTPADAERAMRSFHLSSIRRIWAEAIQYRFKSRSFAHNEQYWFDRLSGTLGSCAKRLPLLGTAIYQACRALEFASLQINICLIATKQSDSLADDALKDK